MATAVLQDVAEAPEQIRPHTGPQTTALSSSADIVIFGGAAGGGKSRCLLMEPLRHIRNPGFGAVIFRNSYPNIFNEGALWDESKKIYPAAGGEPKVQPPVWTFKSGAKVQFRHLGSEAELMDWHGAQIAMIGFDELTEFTEKMFWYLFSRNRSTSGVKPYIRATCNPPEYGDKKAAWVTELISWWLQGDGYADPSKSGVIRWFVRLPEGITWANSHAEAAQTAVDAGIDPKVAENMPKSFTFVPALLSDNPTLERTNPGYRANLMALEKTDRDRLLGGNWKVRPTAGTFFPRSKWRREMSGHICDVPPVDCIWARGWDKAGTEGGKGARSGGVAVGYQPDSRRFFIGHVHAGRWEDLEREENIKSVARRDVAVYGGATIVIEQEPGSGGKQSAADSVRRLAGFDVVIDVVGKSKAARWRPFARQVQQGNVWIIDDGTWDVEGFISELDALSGNDELDKNKLKDLADAASGAFNYLCGEEDIAVEGELLCSGDPADRVAEHEPLTDAEVNELPDIYGDIIRDIREHQSDYDFDDEW